MQTSQATQTDLNGSALVALAALAAELGWRNTALAYIERAYAAFDNDTSTEPRPNRSCPRIRVATLNGQPVDG